MDERTPREIIESALGVANTEDEITSGEREKALEWLQAQQERLAELEAQVQRQLSLLLTSHPPAWDDHAIDQSLRGEVAQAREHAEKLEAQVAALRGIAGELAVSALTTDGENWECCACFASKPVDSPDEFIHFIDCPMRRLEGA